MERAEMTVENENDKKKGTRMEKIDLSHFCSYNGSVILT